MRHSVFVLLAAAAIAGGCGKEPTAPEPQGATPGAALLGGPAAGFVAPGIAFLRRLPANLALTDAQRTQIKGFVSAFQTSTKSDRDALRALFQQAREARRNGSRPDQMRAILQQGAPNRERIQAAAAQLRQQIEGVLTADQKAWVAANAPGRCDRATAPPLTEAQKTQIKALRETFVQANETDLDAIRAAFQQARQARQNGSTPDQVKAILQAVKPAMDRVATARQKLQSDIQGLLTPEQKASGCFGGAGLGAARAMGMGMGLGMRRGGAGLGSAGRVFRRGMFAPPLR